MEDNSVGLPGDFDFAGDYDGYQADADYVDRFPTVRNSQAGGKKIGGERAA